MTKKKEDDTEAEPSYNPSGGIPSHPADPQYGDKDDDDAVDESDSASE